MRHLTPQSPSWFPPLFLLSWNFTRRCSRKWNPSRGRRRRKPRLSCRLHSLKTWLTLSFWRISWNRTSVPGNREMKGRLLSSLGLFTNSADARNVDSSNLAEKTPLIFRLESCSPNSNAIWVIFLSGTHWKEAIYSKLILSQRRNQSPSRNFLWKLCPSFSKWWTTILQHWSSFQLPSRIE